MRFIGNILWLLFGGIIMSLLWAVSGFVLCITIIGIPFGLQCFKIAGFVLWPFGRQILYGDFGAGSLLLNILWLVVFGLEFAIAHIVIGLVYCISIIGIPFGMQHFKLAKLGLIPFGAQIR
ncbi:MAG TPA: YccF domain-containing protein [Clostridiales bacterium]|nr:YccF domain-containing protein [Clostridiales bacterium]